VLRRSTETTHAKSDLWLVTGPGWRQWFARGRGLKPAGVAPEGAEVGVVDESVDKGCTDAAAAGMTTCRKATAVRTEIRRSSTPRKVPARAATSKASVR
jgi:cell division septation protein DedD